MSLNRLTIGGMFFQLRIISIVGSEIKLMFYQLPPALADG
jgi:hypothetical protein